MKQKKKMAEKRLRHTENKMRRERVPQQRYYCTDTNLNKYALCIIKERREEQNSQELLPRDDKKKLKLWGRGKKSCFSISCL